MRPALRPGRRRAAAVALLALSLPTFGACAWRTGPDELGGLTSFANLYSRNRVVCIPTAVGNLSGGLVGAIVVSPLVAAELLAGNSESRRLTRVAVGSPALTLGGVVGAPFLPFSYLLDESPCETRDWMWRPRQQAQTSDSSSS